MDGVECDGVDLGGMTKAEAEKALEKHISGLHKGNMTFTVDDKKVEVSLETLGAARMRKKPHRKLMISDVPEVFLRSIPM